MRRVSWRLETNHLHIEPFSILTQYDFSSVVSASEEDGKTEGWLSIGLGGERGGEEWVLFSLRRVAEKC